MGQRCSKLLMGSWSLPLFESVKMKTPTNIHEPKWTYPGTDEPLRPCAVELVKDVLRDYPNLTAEKTIEILWYFGGN